MYIDLNHRGRVTHICVSKLTIIIPFAKRNCWGYIGFTPSVCPSVRPSRIPCLLCSTYSSGWIRFIFMHLIRQLKKVCRVYISCKISKLQFLVIFKICNFDFVFFWLGIWCESLVWVIIRWRRVSQNAGVLVGSDNGLSPSRHQAIIWTNGGILLIRNLGTNFSEILSEIYTVSFKKTHLKMSSGKCRPFCLGLNVLRHFAILMPYNCHK